MRRWTIASAPAPVDGALLARLIGRLGAPDFATGVLDDLRDAVPAASWSVYRAGRTDRPALFLSGSVGVPDTTRDCWRAYLTGPHRNDRTLQPWPEAPGPGGVAPSAPAPAPVVCHLTAQEVPREHRTKIYDSHGVAERVSVLDRQADGAVFAVNFYRHQHQAPFRDAAIARVGDLAPALLALARKQVAIQGGTVALREAPAEEALARRLDAACPTLTERERAVCLRLLRGMTQEGIACDLGLSVPTVKTYRNRAFARLGIHFRSQLFARVLDA
ncbi:MAG: helix-turn-helix transcriptional regulator [Xylophilus ampelinus]